MRMFILTHIRGTAFWAMTADPHEAIVQPVWERYILAHPSADEAPIMAIYFDGEQVNFDENPDVPLGIEIDKAAGPVEPGAVVSVLAYQCRDCGQYWNPGKSYSPSVTSKQDGIEVRVSHILDDGEPQGAQCPHCRSYNSRAAKSEAVEPEDAQTQGFDLDEDIRNLDEPGTHPAADGRILVEFTEEFMNTLRQIGQRL
jgi:hypothetical protein